MSYWYGALYVVVEGWQELKLTDPVIDGLLRSPNVDLLRRYRNGVFHFQRKFYDERFWDLMLAGRESVEWVSQLHREFRRYFMSFLPCVRKRGGLKPPANACARLDASGGSVFRHHQGAAKAFWGLKASNDQQLGLKRFTPARKYSALRVTAAVYQSNHADLRRSVLLRSQCHNPRARRLGAFER